MEKCQESFESNEAEDCDGNDGEATAGNRPDCPKKQSRRYKMETGSDSNDFLCHGS